MIQRIQSIWLLLAAVASLLTFKFPFYFGQRVGGLINEDLNAASGLLLIIFAAATGIGSFIAIFLYKDRKTQLRIAIAALLLSVLSLVIYFTQIKNFTSGQLTFTAIIAFLVPIFLLLAAKGIWKDQKLIKSLDRLR